jgi:hypothetical protein
MAALRDAGKYPLTRYDCWMVRDDPLLQNFSKEYENANLQAPNMEDSRNGS